MIPLSQVLVLATGLDYRFFGNEAGLLSISVAEGVAYLSLVFIVLGVIRAWAFAPSGQIPGRLVGHWTVGLYLCWVSFAAVANWVAWGNVDALHSFKDSLPGIILYAGLCYWVRTPEDGRRFMGGVFVTLGLLAVLGISQYLIGGPYLAAPEETAFGKYTLWSEGRIDRPVIGSFGTPNAFAVFFSPIWLLAMCYSQERIPTSQHRRVVDATVLLLGACVLVLAQAKIVLAASLTMAAAFWALRRWYPRPRPAMVAAVLVVSLLILAGGVTVLAVLESRLPEGLGLGTMRGRLGLVVTTLEFLAGFPRAMMVGGAVEEYGRSLPVVYIVHNEYLLQALKWGLPGAVLFALAFFGAALRSPGTGWAVPLSIIGAALIFMLETAGGSQRQSMVFLLLGAAHCGGFSAGNVPATKELGAGRG